MSPPTPLFPFPKQHQQRKLVRLGLVVWTRRSAGYRLHADCMKICPLGGVTPRKGGWAPSSSTTLQILMKVLSNMIHGFIWKNSHNHAYHLNVWSTLWRFVFSRLLYSYYDEQDPLPFGVVHLLMFRNLLTC